VVGAGQDLIALQVAELVLAVVVQADVPRAALVEPDA
jgi:hypothetical protein